VNAPWDANSDVDHVEFSSGDRDCRSSSAMSTKTTSNPGSAISVDLEKKQRASDMEDKRSIAVRPRLPALAYRNPLLPDGIGESIVVGHGDCRGRIDHANCNAK
jgi:hypothetical protein